MEAEVCDLDGEHATHIGESLFAHVHTDHHSVLQGFNYVISRSNGCTGGGDQSSKAKMFKLLAFIVLYVLATWSVGFANLASILPSHSNSNVHSSSTSGRVNVTHRPDANQDQQAPIPATTQPQQQSSTAVPTDQQATTLVFQTTTTKTPSGGSSTTFEPNSDPDEPDQLPAPAPPTGDTVPNRNNSTSQTNVQTDGPNDKTSPKVPPKTVGNETTPQTPVGMDHTAVQRTSSTELRVLFYSLFIVYVSFVKLFHHNVQFIKHNLTEPGILMVFGIIWQLVSRQISTDQDSLPRFNSRIFFYLFLPSTVLESASLLSNKWLFFNLLPILTHSIIGTVLYASSMGLTIYSLSRSDIFTQNWVSNSAASSGRNLTQVSTIWAEATVFPNEVAYHQMPLLNQSVEVEPARWRQLDSLEDGQVFGNLTVADCLIFGTILSSIDSTPMLMVFKQYQVNEKLYYLVLGENLMNNAVVIMIFNLLIEFFETTRLTVVKIYFATLQFFANLIISVLIGFALALFAFIAVRLTKRFQAANHMLSSYQNQCQAMIETLLILKLAYLTYTLANLAGTSNIVSLATFGILNDQYIKQNLNLRSQLAFRQVTLATKTLGFSLVYPLLGMLLVDTALSDPDHQHEQTQQTFVSKLTVESANMVPVEAQFEAHYLHHYLLNNSAAAPAFNHAPSLQQLLKTSTSVATKKLTALANQTNLHWNFKFLSIVAILTIVYRFLIVIALNLLGNVLTCGQIKIKFKEQILMAYGGFKGPLSIALVQSLIEQNELKDRMANNRHLFKYTILFNIFISAVLAGTFIRPLVARIQSTLIGHLSTNLYDSRSSESVIVFEKINQKLTENISHGLNSILGHTRSPYDKFIEFNETHIKRWLVRDDSTNTNWLSVFYDNLILDETLNANCFYIATEDPTTIRAFRNQQRQLQTKQLVSTQPHRRRRRSSISFLDPISEYKTLAEVGDMRSRLNSGAPSNRSSMDTSQHSSHLVPAVDPSRKRKSGRQHGLPSGAPVASNQVGPLASGPPVRSELEKDGEVLREFVMLNLKLEEAKKRRQAQKQHRSRPMHLVALSTSEDTGQEGWNKRADAHVNMIDSSTSGDEFKYNNNTLDKQDKQAFLSSMTARLITEPAEASRLAAGNGGQQVRRTAVHGHRANKKISGPATSVRSPAPGAGQRSRLAGPKRIPANQSNGPIARP